MPTKRQLFLSHVAQTSPTPVMIEVERAQGIFIHDVQGKRYYDMNSGISVSSLGHCHPAIVDAIQHQSNKYLHTMVYGEHLQNPQIGLASLLTKQLAHGLDNVYYVMAGTEATEGAMKLAKRYTGRTHIAACKNAYHGSTQGAESLRSDEDYKQAFYPLLPAIDHIEFNSIDSLQKINNKTAGVVIELVQAEAGVILPDPAFLEAIQQKCADHGALLIIDEIQTGFGRTGQLFAHEKYNIKPDILLTGKAMGGGMPIAAFISTSEIMQSLMKNPNLGHITTFGGHPVCCAAAEACLTHLLSSDIVADVSAKEKLIHQTLQHTIIKEIRSSGLMMAVELTKRKYLKHVVSKALELGIIVDWFLFNNRSFRLAPPLIISPSEIKEACGLLLEAMDYAYTQYS